MSFLGKPTEVSASIVWDGSQYIGSIRPSNTKLFLASYLTTTATSSSPETVGGNQFVPSEHNTNNCVLRSILAVTTGSSTTFIQMFNVTSGSLVHIGGSEVTELSSSSTTPEVLESVDLFSATNFSTGSAIYDIRIYGTGSGEPVSIHRASELICT